MKLKILHAIATVNPATGGPIEGVRQIARINHGYGHQIELLTLDPPDAPWLKDFPLRVHAMGPGRTAFGFSRRFVEWLRANRGNYDCVVVNGVWGFNCYGVWRALRGTGMPYYVYTHGMLDPWFKYRYPFKHVKKWLFWPWAVYPALRDAAGVMFTCEEERRLARESFWLYDCNEIVVNYGTPGAPDPQKDYAAGFVERHPELKDKRRFVFLGRVHPKKGADLLIQALAALRSEGLWDQASMRVIMAGPADGAYAAELKSLASRLGVAESLHWTGMLLGDDKWGALQCAEAFVLPSHQENFGIAVAEALSVGVPVLISRSVNIWAEITQAGAGLAEEDTADGCLRLFRRWFELPEAERVAMQARARECFAQRFTSRRAAVSLLSNIFQVMHSAGMRSKSRDAETAKN